MKLRICRFCNYDTNYKNRYYSHLHTHINDDNIAAFSEEELYKSELYYKKMITSVQKYRKTDKYKQKCEEKLKKNKSCIFKKTKTT